MFDPKREYKLDVFVPWRGDNAKQHYIEIDEEKQKLWAKLRKEVPPEYRHNVEENELYFDDQSGCLLELIYIPLGE